MSSNSAGSLSLCAPSSSSSPSAAARALGLAQPASKTGKRSFNKEFDKENIKRHRSFQTTLHPYNPSSSQVNNPPSPAASVNFIEETFWDYYDYEYENSSSDPGSTPRNPRRTVTAAAISETSSAKRSAPHSKANTRINSKYNSRIYHPIRQSSNKNSVVTFRTDSNRSSCERSLGETMDYDCSLRMNQFDMEMNGPGGRRGNNENRSEKESPYPTLSPEYRRHGEMSVHSHPRSSYHYATISSSANPYLPASEYVYRRRHHDHEMPNEAPPKPERKFRNSKRSMSLNAYDGRKLFSPLRTYCVLMKENIEPENAMESNRGDVNVNGISSTTLSNDNPSPDSGHQRLQPSDPTRTTSTTSAIMNNTSPISLSFTSTNSTMKFNSLPRERYIRIEREDGDGSSSNTDKFSSLKYPSSRKSDMLLLGKADIPGNRERNVTRVPINKDDSGGNSLNFPTHRSNNFTFTPPKTKIERSQSHREISSSRPYYPNVGVSPSATSQNTLPRHYNQLSANFPEKSSSNTVVDLNFSHPAAGTASTLPNFRTGRIKPARNPKPVPPASTTYNAWGDSGNKSDSGSFFRSDFDDGSDVVIENFIKVHSNKNNITPTTNNSTSNTLPKRKYPPTTTHISSNTPPHQQQHPHRRASDDNDYSHISAKSSDLFQQVDPSIDYLRQCSTFPRGARTKKEQADPPAEKQTEHLPNLHKSGNAPSNQRNNSPPSSGDKLDAFMHPSTSNPPKSSVTLPHSNHLSNVPTQQPERSSVSIKLGSTLTGPGSSATLPHPYIRRNKQLSINSNSSNNNGSNNNDGKQRNGAAAQTNNVDPGPSISQVEMEIERDIFFQKTKSLDRARPSSKSRLKSVLGLGKSKEKDASITDVNNAANLHPHPMEIDYSDSQPYNNKGRMSSQENIFSIDQLDKKYANQRTNGTSKSPHVQANMSNDQLKPQQIHHSNSFNSNSNSNASPPIPSPRLKRKAKLQQSEPNSSLSSSQTQQHANPMMMTTVCSPKINGDEMSSSASSKLIGPGTSYGSEKLPYFPPSNNVANEPDPYNQPQQQHYQSQRILSNEMYDPPSSNSFPKPNASIVSNPISSGSSTNLNASSSKISFAKDTSIKADHHLSSSSPTTVFNGMSGSSNSGGSMGSSNNSNSVDGIMRSASSNHISQPTSGSAILNYSNSDSPGVNFMISNSSSLSTHSPSPSVGELDSSSPQQQPFSPVADSKGRVTTTMHNISPLSDSPSSQQIKSALANSSGGDPSSKLANAGGGGTGKAVRFEPHVIAMEIESEQRKLLLQQQLSGTGGGSVLTHNNSNNNHNSGINSVVDGGDGGSPSNINGNGSSSGMKSNSGHNQHHPSSHNMQRHVYGNKGRHHYVHASSSYLPVLYHSYHNQQHKYIRKGANGNIIAGGGSKGGKNKSKKYKGFVARAIAKVKSKAANIKKESSASSSSSSTSTASPTVYYPAPQGNGKGVSSSSSMQPPHHGTNSNNANNLPPSSASSVITYISPQPQAQHSQPPAQHSLEEVSAAQQQHSNNVPTITVSLTTTGSSAQDHVAGLQSLTGQSKKYYTTPSGKLKKSSPGKSHKGLKIVSSVGGGIPSGARRMDGYLDSSPSPTTSRVLGGEENPEGQSQYPDSFSLHTDRITPSSTSSSSSSSFTSNLQESYELFHNQALPDSAHELVANATKISGPYPADHHRSDMGGEGEIEEHFDSMNEDSDNANEGDDDGHFAFKSFDESDSENEDEEPDFVFYPAPNKANKPEPTIVLPPIPSGSVRPHHHNHIDMDRNKIITSASTPSESYAPFPPSSSTITNSNETTTKGNSNNFIGGGGVGGNANAATTPQRSSDPTKDNDCNSSMRNKGKSWSAEPKMVVGIPTYRSPNTTRQRLITNSHKQQQQPPHHHHYGKCEASVPNANPTISPNLPKSINENVKLQSSSSPSSTAATTTTSSSTSTFYKEPHPLLHQENFSSPSSSSPSPNESIRNRRDLHSHSPKKDSSSTSPSAEQQLQQQQQRSSSKPSYEYGYEAESTPAKDAGIAGGTKGLSKPQQHEAGKKESQSHSHNKIDGHNHDHVLKEEKSQSFLNMKKPRNLSTGRATTAKSYGNEHEGNTDVIEDTLQRSNNVVDANMSRSNITPHVYRDDDDSCKTERVTSYPNNPRHDAPTSQGKNSCEGIASATTTTTTTKSSTGGGSSSMIAGQNSGTIPPPPPHPSHHCNNNSTNPTAYHDDHPNNEGRLTDLTTTATTTTTPTVTSSIPPTITRSTRGHVEPEQLAAPKNVDELIFTAQDDERGLRHAHASVKTRGTVTPNYVNRDAHPPPPSSYYNISTLVTNVVGDELKNHLQEVRDDEASSVLQARTSSTSSWASKDKAKDPSGAPTTSGNSHNYIGIPNTNRKSQSQSPVTNNGNVGNETSNALRDDEGDVGRLRRLELVKRQQNLLAQSQKANFNFPNSNHKSEHHIGVGGGRNEHNEFGDERETSEQQQQQRYLEQPNSLETQCANDQSVLSESEVSSCGKSPSPSPRFRAKNKQGNRSGGRVGQQSRFHQGGSSRPSNPSNNSNPSSGSEKDSPGRVRSSHNHHNSNLLNSHSEQSENQKASRSGGAGGTTPYSNTKGKEDSSEDLPDSPGSGSPVGMSLLPPSSLSVNDNGGSGAGTNFGGRFKSRVLLNSDDLEDDEELSRAVADAISNSKGANKGPPNHRNLHPHPSSVSPSGGKKNVTTVEISGDVGIVSNNLLTSNLAPNNNHGSSGGGRGPPTSYKNNGSSNSPSSIHKRHLQHDHLQSSGLSLIPQPSLLDLNSDNESFVDDQSGVGGIIAIEKPIEPEIKTKLVDKVVRRSLSEEVGSSVSANGSSGGSGDNDTEKTSDDNSSDWQSESTNTVIFRGNPGVVDSDHPFYHSPSYNDPEIQINNITVGGGDEDDEQSGSDLHKHGPLSPSFGKVNVGHKATKVNKVSTDLIIGIKGASTTDKLVSSSSTLSTGEDSHAVKIGSKRKFDKNNDLSSSSSSSTGDSSEELGKSNETLTDIPVHDGSSHEQVVSRIPEEVEEQDHLEVEMVIHPDSKIVNGGNRHFVQGNTKSPHHRRESPEGQEQEVPDRSSEDNSKGPTKSSIPPPNHIVKEQQQIIEQSSPTLVPNAKEKKMEESSGGSSGAGGGSAHHPADVNPNHGHGGGGRPKKKTSSRTINKEKILQTMLSQIPSRSSPDGADAEKSDATPEPEVESPIPAGAMDTFDVTSEDDDSWVEEILFEDEDDTSFEEVVKKLPPPLDLTLHTIVEESCEESEAENSGNFYQPSTSGLGGSQKNPSLSQSESNANELEKYFNFGIYTDPNSGKNSIPNEESEFSDTFSESSFSLQEDDFNNGNDAQGPLLDPAELASTRLEKYFYNLGGPQSMMNPMRSSTMDQNADSDSVGSDSVESDSDNSILEKRKKVLKHHRRSADFDDEFGDKVSDEEESFGFGQDGFDTIKKTARKTKKSGSEGSLSNDSNNASANAGNQSLSGIMTDQGANNAMSSSSKFETRSPKPILKKSDSGSSSGNNQASPNQSSNEKPVIKVNRSNSFTWSSDEEVNIMMSKLRQLIKNLIKSKAEAGNGSSASAQPSTSAHPMSTSETGSGAPTTKDKQLVYLENELIRLMKTDNLKNIVEYLSSEESDVDDVYKFIKVVNSSGSTPVDLDDLGDLGDLDIDDPHLLENLHSTMQLQEDGTMAPGSSPKSSPALLAKVMHHIGNRLNMWMKDEGNLEDDNNDDNVTLKCAPSVSSDLNEDRFSWKGSFESALAAKRQSVGSTDSISSSDYGQDKSMLRSSSLHHLTTSQPIEENKEEEEPASSLPRMTNLCNSLPRLNQPNNQAISRAHSLVMTAGKNEQQPAGTETYPVSISGPVKSARYRPPGFQPSMKAKRVDTEEKASPSILSQSTPVLTQDSAILKNRSDSMGSIFNDVKPLISVKGQVEFGLQYNYKLACLEVKISGCRDLASADTKRNRSDPYVKAYLLPDKSKAGKRKTKTKKNTLSPIFDEILKFPLTLSDLQNRTLWLSVWHSDMFGKNEFLGEILVNLKDRVFDDPNPGWWDLQEMSGQMEDMPKGDVVIALKWQPKTDSTGNLSVLVKEAKNLVPVKNGSPSTFVKCALLSDKTRKQKTSICRRNFNPIWNQTLLFDYVDDEGVELTIWNHDLLASHDLIGTIRLEYDSPLWESMISRPSFWVEGVLKLS